MLQGLMVNIGQSLTTFFRKTYEEIVDDKGLLQYIIPSFKHYTIGQSDSGQESKDAAMTVYVLYWQEYDEVQIMGVYSSRKKAEDAIRDDEIDDRGYEWFGYHIEEHILDC